MSIELTAIPQYHVDNPHSAEDYTEAKERRQRERRLSELEMKVAIDERLKSRDCANECPSMIELRTKYNDIIPAMEKAIESIQASVKTIETRMTYFMFSAVGGIAVWALKELWSFVTQHMVK